MAEDDLEARHALGPGGADVVLPEHVEHRRAGQTRDVGHRVEAERDDRQDQAVFLRQRFEQLLALFILINAESIGQKDQRVRQVGKACRIVFAFHHQHPVGVEKFSFAHRPLPASARRQRAAVPLCAPPL